MEGPGPALGPLQAEAAMGLLGAGRSQAAPARPGPRLRRGRSRGAAAGGCGARLPAGGPSPASLEVPAFWASRGTKATVSAIPFGDQTQVVEPEKLVTRFENSCDGVCSELPRKKEAL